MRTAFTELLSDLESADAGVVGKACSDAALLLERHVYHRYGDEMYLELLGNSELLDLELDTNSYNEIVSRLRNILDRRGQCADVAAWAAGKTRDVRLRLSLLCVLRDHDRIEDDNLIYQTIIALENHGLDEEIVDLLQRVSLSQKLVRSSERAIEILSMPPEILKLEMS